MQIRNRGFSPYKHSCKPKRSFYNTCCSNFSLYIKEETSEYKASKNDYDSPWKEALTDFFPQSIQLFLPYVHKQINWSVKPVFLDKEFQAFKVGTTKGRKYVDKLVQLQLLSGATNSYKTQKPGR